MLEAAGGFGEYLLQFHFQPKLDLIFNVKKISHVDLMVIIVMFSFGHETFDTLKYCEF